ncbi:MAG: hypothetical protein FWE71_08480 [Nocardioidaceae bacterium]|nr:hypothetical protein [Nocardioidaceae bacterium]MCL2613540.1 hypothetical protein [Nocardioidaceae bacterium]
MPDDAGPALISYAEWGERFFATAVTQERVMAGIDALAGRPIDVGPLGVGPGRVVKVTAKGSIGRAVGRRVGDSPIVFHVDLPVDLAFTIDLGVDKQRFDAALNLPLVLTARGRDDLFIEIVVTPPKPAEIQVRLEAKGLRASVMARAAKVEAELRRFVAKYVAREVEKPAIAEARLIDVGAAIDRAAGGLVPTPDDTELDAMAGDLSTALGTEITATADQFLEEES